MVMPGKLFLCSWYGVYRRRGKAGLIEGRELPVYYFEIVL